MSKETPIKRGLLTIDQGMKVRVKILQVKSEFGLVRYVITPVSGEGQAKVNADRVEVEP